MNIKAAYQVVREVADATLPVSGPSSHGILTGLADTVFGELSVGNAVLDAADGGGDEVAPTLTHAAGLSPAETACNDRAASETGRQAVGKLMDDDAILRVTVPVRAGGVPEDSPMTILNICAIVLVNAPISKQVEHTRRGHEAHAVEHAVILSLNLCLLEVVGSLESSTT